MPFLLKTTFWLFLLFPITTKASTEKWELLNLNKTQKACYNKIGTHLSNKNYDQALSKLNNCFDPELLKFVLWKKYLNKNNNIEEINGFIEANPHFPKINILQKNIESGFNEKTPISDILNFFQTRHPITIHAQILYLIARKKIGEISANILHQKLTDIWIENNIQNSTDEKLIKKYISKFTVSDYIKKIDRLIWQNQFKKAEQLLNKVPTTSKNIFIARLKLAKDKSGVDAAIHKIPEKYQKLEGLIYERVKWAERKNLEENITQLLPTISSYKNSSHQKDWWKVKLRQIYHLVARKQYKTAYKFASSHNIKAGDKKLSPFYAEANWLSGWISLRFLYDPKTALTHFMDVYNNVSYSISRARASYWIGRSHEAIGNFAEATRWYNIAATYPTTFYGQIALINLDLRYKNSFEITDINVQKTAVQKLINIDEISKIAYISGNFGFASDAMIFFKKNIKKNIDYTEIAQIVELSNYIEHKQNISAKLARFASRFGIDLIDKSFPTPINIEKTEPNRSLIMAITRQESGFSGSLVSSAGAMGFMQIMPATAKDMTRRMRIPYSQYKLRNDPYYNMKIGIYYINYLMKRYDNSKILAIAAYNAGPTSVNRWIREFGDPRKMSNLEDIIDWIEKISYSETRNYVHRVLEGVIIYDYLSYKNSVKSPDLQNFKQKYILPALVESQN